MLKFGGCAVLLLFLIAEDVYGKKQTKVHPSNEYCDPLNGVCRKGDWIDPSIADCNYTGSIYNTGRFSCQAKGHRYGSWIVDEEVEDACQPSRISKSFVCGAPGTNTRCVCSDNKYWVWPNECRCQYWPDEDPGSTLPAACVGHHTGGLSTFHHWACCNNCNDPPSIYNPRQESPTCDGVTWQGGSRNEYCGTCGRNIGGGRIKSYFNCESCGLQEYCAFKCRRNDYPGWCWRWLECFENCCTLFAQQPIPRPPPGKRQVTDRSFCGDSTCDKGETPSSCPTDCCYLTNSMCAENSTNCAVWHAVEIHPAAWKIQHPPSNIFLLQL